MTPPRRPLLAKESSAEWPPPCDPPELYTPGLHFNSTHGPATADEASLEYETGIKTITRHPSFELLTPSHECPTRRTALMPAVFNLVATIVGGGILSVPLALRKGGLVPGTAMMVLAAFLTDFSLYVLCSCARRTGSRSYGEVCRRAFGPGLELFTTLLLFTFLLFVLVAYMVLIRDIWTPLIDSALQWLGKFFLGDDNEDEETSLRRSQRSFETNGDVVLLGIVLLMSPFLLSTDLHSLRYNCYVGFASISVLCLAISYRAWERWHPTSDDGGGSITVSAEDELGVGVDILIFPEGFSDLLFAFPIITLSFLSSFNILSVHGSLIDPTRRRIRCVIDGAVAACFVLTYAFGLAGYLYAGSDVEGNILLNFDAKDPLIFAGRVGCGLTISLAMAMITLPCRESLLAFVSQFEKWKDEETTSRAKGPSDVAKEVAGYGATAVPTDKSNSEAPDWHRATQSDVQRSENKNNVGQNKIMHLSSTFAIVSTCYIGAVAAPGVAIVWSICGSSMAFIIAFILPAACYIKVRAGRKGHTNVRIMMSWIMLLLSIVGAIACTIQTIGGMLKSFS